jgi:simple sugar transport system ATP-binding protein
MAKDGHALIFISHKLHEVMAFTHRVTVLRDGKNVGTVNTVDTNKNLLAEMMVGRPLNFIRNYKTIECGKPRLKVENLSALSDRGVPALKNVSFEVCAGEVLGLAGVSGNGQPELAQVIAGLRPSTSGKIMIDDETLTGSTPMQVIEKGVAYIPEKRNVDGLIKEFSVSENLILRDLDREFYSKNAFLNMNNIAKRSADLVKTFNVKTPSIDTPIKSLSGGNAQKVILAREISRQPRVLIAAQPTRGVDIGATEYIHERIIEQRETGTATLLISEDLDEIFALSDRRAVICQGEIMGVVDRKDATLQSIGLMMAGEQPPETQAAE